LREYLFLSTYKYVTRTEILSIEADLERSKSIFVVKAILSVTNLAFNLTCLFMNMVSGHGHEHRRQGIYDTIPANQNARIQHGITANLSGLTHDRAKLTKFRIYALTFITDRYIALIGTKIRSDRTGTQMGSEG
jgi:hypothetical protein